MVDQASSPAIMMLDALYPRDFDGWLHIAEFSEPPKVEWFCGSERKQLARRSIELSRLANIYCGICATRERRGRRQRSTIKTVAFIPALWAEIDLLGALDNKGRPKQDVPTFDVSLDALGRMPLAPSIVQNSGGGLHVFWLLDHVFEVGHDGDRERIANAERLWLALMQATIGEAYPLDSVHDLARVLRLPGTLNHKYDPPRTVKIIKPAAVEGLASAPRYSLVQFEAAIETAGLAVNKPEQLPSSRTPSAPPILPTGRSVDVPDRIVRQAIELISRDGGRKFFALEAGENLIGDTNRDDLSFCGQLAFWLGCDPPRIDQWFRASGRMRPKWDEVHFSTGETYGQRTIAKALAGKTNFYDWSWWSNEKGAA